MKKILFLFLLAVAISSAKQAGAQQKKFYYYPNSNMYYDVGSHQYIYLNNSGWVNVNTLPPGIIVNKTRRVVIYNPTPDIWVHNNKHKLKYKNTYPKGKAVGYKGTNPNKAQGKSKSH